MHTPTVMHTPGPAEPVCVLPKQELLDKCHPLGMFDSIATLAVASNMRELYRLVLVDTPLAPYFSESPLRRCRPELFPGTICVRDRKEGQHSVND